MQWGVNDGQVVSTDEGVGDASEGGSSVVAAEGICRSCELVACYVMYLQI